MRGRRRGETDRLSRLFHALADPTRRSVLARLSVGPARVTDLARPFRMSLPAVSKHLGILEGAGLVHRTVDGRVHRLSLAGEQLREVEVWLDPFRSYWEMTLTSLGRSLARPRTASGRSGGESPGRTDERSPSRRRSPRGRPRRRARGRLPARHGFATKVT